MQRTIIPRQPAAEAERAAAMLAALATVEHGPLYAHDLIVASPPFLALRSYLPAEKRSA
jgi:hypothetical protein